MPDYAARVELHSATREDYEELHEFMQQRGFGRVVTASDGTRHHLPTGTYVGAAHSVQEAFKRAHAAADETGRTSWTVVFSYDAWWGNLPEV
jgi:hypothetical protein